MDILTTEKLKTLIQKKNGICLSIFLPTFISGKEVEQNHIRYKNLVRQAEDKLNEQKLRPNEIEQLLKPIRTFIDDKLFWKYQSNGLAVFRSADEFQTYRLPLEFEELVVVSERFHVKPLLPILSSDGQYYILAFSMNNVRLFQGTRYSVSELNLEGVPNSLSEALKYELYERELQFHTGGPRHGGKRDAQFYGTGAGEPDTKENLLRYFQQLDKGVREFLKEDNAPLVLAGVDYLWPIYKDANKYAHLASEGVPGNPESVSVKELHERSWQIVQPKFYESQSKDSDKLKQLLGTNSNLATLDIDDIVKASFAKRVETLFVATGIQVWGKFDETNLAVEIHETRQENDEDLLDLSSVYSLANGGKVYAVPHKKMFRQKPIAAIFRF